MTTLAAIRVCNGEIVQRAGRASDVSITPADNGFILHGALGPAPDKWVQSPDDVLIGWSQEPEGIRIWTTHPEPTIRFVPDIALEPDAEGNTPDPLPAPDWSRVLTVQQAQDRVKEQMARERATAIAQLAAVDSVLDTLPDEDVETLTYLYPEWEPGMVTAAHDAPAETQGHRKVRRLGVLYKVVQGHTTQADWPPESTPAVFTRFRDPAAGPQPWQQLTPPDTYDAGDRVTHDNPNDASKIWVYESEIDANTTEPGRDGTFDRWWTPIAPV